VVDQFTETIVEKQFLPAVVDLEVHHAVRHDQRLGRLKTDVLESHRSGIVEIPQNPTVEIHRLAGWIENIDSLFIWRNEPSGAS